MPDLHPGGDRRCGLVQLPLADLMSGIEAGRLVALLDGWVQPQIDAFCLYYSSRRQMRPPLKALLDFIRERYVATRAGPPPTGNRPLMRLHVAADAQADRRSGWGHEGRFPTPRLSGRCGSENRRSNFAFRSGVRVRASIRNEATR